MNAPLAPPTFSSLREYVSRVGDVGFWCPYIAEISNRHGFFDAGHDPVAGINGTYPAFLLGDVVVKLFGCVPAWRRSYAAERGAQALLATDPEISAPRLLAEGRLYEKGENSWPYIITTRVSGVPWADAKLSRDERLTVAADLGTQIRRVHALQPSGVATHADWPNLNVAAAAAQSSLPPHLVAQVDDYLASLKPFDCVFVHGDLFARHPFVENGRLAGIIDWADALVTDRHYELAKLHLDTFDCDRNLLGVFLKAGDWPMTEDFPRQAMGMALHRQALGNAQHLSNDAFFKLPALLPLQDIGTLDELATELFAV